MASDFVRNIKDVRNIDILSPNITTENDLISTSDGEVYVVTKKGYRKITGVETEEIKQLKTDVSNVKIQSDTNTLNISDLTDDIETNTSDIVSLNKSTETIKNDVKSLKSTTSKETIKNDVKSLKSTTSNHTSEIETLSTTTDKNTSEIEKLNKSTGNNTSEIEKLKKSTGNNTSDIESLNKSTGDNTSEIETLKKSTSNNGKNIDSNQTLIEQLQKQLDELKSNTRQYYTLFEGKATGLGTRINLKDSYKNYSSIKIHIKGYGGNDIKAYEGTNNSSNIVVYTMNVTNRDGNDGDITETEIKRTSERVFTISNQAKWRFKTQKGEEVRKGIVITKIEGVK